MKLFTFSPSPEMAGRGISVEVVRTRLQAIGEITAVAPRVTAAGGIAFDFTVALERDREPDQAWQADGISWQDLVEDEVPDAIVAPADITDSPAPRSNLIRVDLGRLDDLMLLVGELVMTRS